MAGDDVYGSPGAPAVPRRGAQVRPDRAGSPGARVRREAGGPTRRSFASSARWACSASATTPKYGGQGLDYSYHAVFLEELALCDNAGVAMGVSVQTDMATPALHRFGSEELKQRYLVPGHQGRAGRGHRRHRAGRRLRRRRDQDAGGARRRPVGDQRLEDVHHQHRERRLAVPARRHRSRRRLSRLHADRRADGRARASATSSSTRSATAAPTRVCSSSTTSGCRVANTDRRSEPGLSAADGAVPGRAHGAGGDVAGLGAPSLGADAGARAAARRLRPAAREDAGEPLQVRRDDDPDHRRPGDGPPVHPQDGRAAKT